MITYCAGFMFSNNLSEVLLIQKVKPAWQAGKWNGIGGELEEEEKPLTAMCREFSEEVCKDTIPEQWYNFCTLTDGDREWRVHFYSTTGYLHDYIQTTEERPNIFYINNLPDDLVDHVRYLIPMALSKVMAEVVSRG